MLKYKEKKPRPKGPRVGVGFFGRAMLLAPSTPVKGYVSSPSMVRSGALEKSKFGAT